MELQSVFDVPAPCGQVWDALIDVERVVPCMPGAELTEVVDDKTWKGKVTLKLGAVSLVYRGKVSMKERDDVERRVVLAARGTEARGKGTAAANVTGSVEALEDGGSRVVMVTDLSLSGAPAQFGRGMIADVSKRLTDQFAECLRTQLARAGGGQPSGSREEPQPIQGVRLALWSIGRALLRLVKRVLGRSTHP